MNVSVTLDTREAEAMFERLGRPLDVRPALSTAAEQAARMVTGIPVGETGQLAGGVTARVYRRVALIVIAGPAAEYARFVFGGTRHMAAQPPSVPGDAIAALLADEVIREIDRR